MFTGIAYAAEETATVVAEQTGIIHFLFETYAGIGVLVGSCLVLSLVVAFLLEMRTRRVFKDRGPKADGDSFFDDIAGEE